MSLYRIVPFHWLLIDTFAVVFISVSWFFFCLLVWRCIGDLEDIFQLTVFVQSRNLLIGKMYIWLFPSDEVFRRNFAHYF